MKGKEKGELRGKKGLFYACRCTGTWNIQQMVDVRESPEIMYEDLMAVIHISASPELERC